MDYSSLTAAFLEDARIQLKLLQDALHMLTVNATDAQALMDLRRGFHTLKSTAATMSFVTLSELCKEHEAVLLPLLETKSSIAKGTLTEMQQAVMSVENELQNVQSAMGNKQ